MNRRTLVFTLAIALLAAASTWLSRGSRQETRQAEAASSASDYFLDRFVATELGKNGQPVRRLEAEHLSHYPADRSAMLREPHMTLYRPAEAPWQVTAQQARLLESEDRLQLTGGVRVFREGPDATEITTESLWVRPKLRYAETADPVLLTAPSGTVRAVGMEAFLEEERVILKNQVRGVYAVP